MGLHNVEIVYLVGLEQHILRGKAYRSHLEEQPTKSLRIHDVPGGTVYIPWNRIVMVTDKGSGQ